jgi:hypothetical protein
MPPKDGGETKEVRAELEKKPDKSSSPQLGKILTGNSHVDTTAMPGPVQSFAKAASLLKKAAEELLSENPVP